MERLGPMQLLDEQGPFLDLGVGRQHPHPEAEGAAGDLTADAAEADDEQRFARELVQDDLVSP